MINFSFDEDNRNTKMLSSENLILEIEKLEVEGIISFEDFKALPFSDIQQKYFAMPNYTMMQKAIIKISDKRNGKTDLSFFSTTKQIIDTEGNVTTEIRTHRF
jgi:hypothetical protein